MAGPSMISPGLHNTESHDRVVGPAPGPWFQKIALSFDGGGVRGYWSLLVLQQLMIRIRDFELIEDRTTRSSFHPCEKPDNVSQLANLSNLENPTEYNPFLPCHYFDYIGGTSTGALIAILLSRFRMTVEDCLREYETMVGTVFENPRVLHKMNIWTLTRRNKYSRKALKDVFQDVIERRSQVTEGDTEPLFQTEIDTCRGVVLATRMRGAAEKQFLFRSYTPYEERRRNSQQTLHMKNPNEGMRTGLLKVALAGTAASFYFGHYHTILSTAQAQGASRIPTTYGTNASRNGTGWSRRVVPLPEGKSNYEFVDAGFSRDNNPTHELYREIQYHHGENAPVLVSIGTARPKGDFVGEGARTTVERGMNNLGDPEPVHEGLELDKHKGNYAYYRLNDGEHGYQIAMDDWKPKKVGSETRARMREHFNDWLQKEGVEDRFKECAQHLVRLRRVRMNTPRWERFALGQYFVCQVQNCPKDRDNQWLDKSDFENHLRREHREGDYEGIEMALDSCRRIWRYKQRTAPP